MTRAIVQVLQGHNGLAAFRLVQPVNVRSYIVPADFISDGETIPWFVQWAFPRASNALLAAFAHDHRMVSSRSIEERFKAHRHFREDLRELGVPNWRRQLMWRGAMAADRGLPFFKRLWQALR